MSSSQLPDTRRNNFKRTALVLFTLLFWTIGDATAQPVAFTHVTVITEANGRHLDRQGLTLLAQAEAAAGASSDPSPASQEQPVGDDLEATVLAEIEEQHRREQKAFREGDCERVASFYSDGATRYLVGRRISLQEGLAFCRKLPRPFGQRYGSPKINDAFQVLSDNAAYFVRTIDFPPSDDDPHSFKREVVTKVWSKTTDGWKIVHFHSSIHSVSKE